MTPHESYTVVQRGNPIPRIPHTPRMVGGKERAGQRLMSQLQAHVTVLLRLRGERSLT